MGTKWGVFATGQMGVGYGPHIPDGGRYGTIVLTPSKSTHPVTNLPLCGCVTNVLVAI